MLQEKTVTKTVQLYVTVILLLSLVKDSLSVSVETCSLLGRQNVY